jgi:hypothetical protein
MYSYSTIQQLIDGEYTIHAYCHGRLCSHHQKLDLEKLKASLGGDFKLTHDTLTPKLRCTKCGGKKVGLIVSPPKMGFGNPYQRQKEGRSV